MWSTYIVEEEGKPERGRGIKRGKSKRIAQVVNCEDKELTGVDIAVNRTFGEGFECFQHSGRPEHGGGSEDQRQKREN